jgi:hypothetical protein
MKTMTMPRGSLHARVAPETYDEEARTVDVIWSTGADVRRTPFFGDTFVERLRMDEDAVDMSRLQSGKAPVLRDHDQFSIDSVIGVVRSASIKDGVGHATVEFSQRASLSEMLDDLRAGILGQVSVGYSVEAYVRTERDGEPDLLEAVRWTPHEISLVPIGADGGAVARNQSPAVTATVKERTMSEEQETTTAPAESAAAETEATATTLPAAPEESAAVTAEEAVSRALAAERRRVSGIRHAVRSARLPDSAADNMIEQGISLDHARAAVIDALAQRDEATDIRTASPVVESGRSGAFVEAAVDGLLYRSGQLSADKLSPMARDCAGMRIMDIGQALLSQRGLSTRGTDVELITRMISSSELVPVVAQIATRAVSNGYQSVPTTYQALSRQATARNFQEIQRARLSGAPELLEVPEGGEIRKGPLSAGYERYSLKTYGRRVALTRQAIINDDLDTLARLPAAFGAKARQLENRTFYELLGSNPVMSDGNAFFSSAHKNIGTSADISKTSVMEARQLMRSQVDSSGNPIYVTPRYLVFGPASAEEAMTFLTPTDAYIAASAAAVVPEMLRSLIPIEDQEITGDEWYLVAEPSGVDTFEYAYLGASAAGVSTGPGPQVDSRAGFEILGVDTRCVLDFGMGAIDWVGMVYNAGA